MDEDRPLAHVVHGRVVDEVEPRVVVLGDVVHGEEDRLAALLAPARGLDVALDVHVDLPHPLRLDDVLVDVARHLDGGGGGGVGRHEVEEEEEEGSGKVAATCTCNATTDLSAEDEVSNSEETGGGEKESVSQSLVVVSYWSGGHST